MTDGRQFFIQSSSMQRGRARIPDALSDQARACVETAAQAAGFFRAPSEAGAFAAREKALTARAAGLAAITAIEACRDDSNQSDWLSISRFLAEAAAEMAAGAVESCRFGANESMAGLAANLRDAGQDLNSALAAIPDAKLCEGFVISAKRRLAEAERLGRVSRNAALDDPNAVRDIKTRAVLQRLSRASEAWQQAVDRVVEMLEMKA
jgi:hypothetical protein